MKSWKRVTQKDGQACGSCRSVVSQGGVFLEIEIVETGTKRARCAACAKSLFGEEPPADLPAAVAVPSSAPKPHVQATVVARDIVAGLRAKFEIPDTANDFKRRQSGE